MYYTNLRKTSVLGSRDVKNIWGNDTFAKPAIAKHVYGDREMSKTHHKVAPQANQPS